MSVVVPNTPIAIVGVSALFPGSTEVAGFWRDVVDGRDRIEPIPPTHWLIEDYYDPDPAARDKTYARRGAFLSALEFDPLEHGLPPTSARATDTAQLLGLVLAKQVLHDATRGAFPNVDRERIGVILGATGAQELITQMAARMQRPVWVKALREHGLPEEEVQSICDRMSDSYVPWQESTFPGLLGNVIAGRIANRFDLGGTNCILDAACASSLAAVAMAVDELRLGKADMVLTGGVETLNDIVMFMCFSKTPAISPTEDCRPFSAKGDGTMLGEGVCMLALRRLADAERDGNHIYAVLRGIGSSSDGRAKSVYAPVPEGQAKALRRAYEDAGYGPDSVELVEAHGTGTKAGDAAEFSGLRMVFEDQKLHGETPRREPNWCALGSVKSQLGHTKAAAGAAGLLKAVLALHHRVLPPTIKIDEPNPLLEIENSPFYLSRATRPWISDRAHPRRASVSSFGFGGSNFHVALEEYTGAGERPPRLRTNPTELVVLSAQSPPELIARCRATIADIEATQSLPLAAYTTQRAFDGTQPARLAIVASDATDLRGKLTDAAVAIERAPTSPYVTPRGVHYALGAQPGELAFLFPGQGSQYVGMGADVAMAFDVALQAWERAAEVPFDGTRLDRVVFPHPVFGDAANAAQVERLMRTEWVQPAIGVASVALMAVLRSLGIRPAMVGGHSFGEVTALHAAGAFDERALLAIARRRGELMAAAADRPGGMIALAQSIEEAKALIARLGLDLVVANHNAPKQVVLSGERAAIEAGMAKLSAAGINAKQLPVATAFHSPVVAASSEPFGRTLEQVAISAPTIPVMANSQAAPYPSDPAAVRELLAGQIARPVRFVEEIVAMYAAGARTFIEVGPGSVLTQLVGDILAGDPHRAVALDRKGQHGVTALWGALAQLAVAGVAIDFAPLWAAYAPPVDPRARKKPAMTLSITGTNYGKPYPPAGGAAALPKPNPPRPKAAPAAAPVMMEPGPKQVLPSASQVAPPQTSAQSVAVSPAVPAAVSGDPSPAWIAAYQDMQRQTAEAHAAYVKAMADSHHGFLRTAEVSLAALGGLLGGGVSVAPVPEFLPAPSPAVAPLAAAAPLASEPPARPVARIAEPAPQAAAPAPAVPVPAKAIIAAAPARDLTALLLTVVADKTGYPPEMLGMDMALEADLGIDSIKRVEILAAMKEQAPELPAVAASEMAALRTLGQIVASLESRSPSPVVTAATPAAKAAPERDLKALLLAVVADKTGYPPEMLGMDMALEADLGIDSIKRVEILAAMKEQVPELPSVAASEMAALRTLGQIVSSLEGRGSSQPKQAPSPKAPTASPQPGHARKEMPTRFALREVPAPSTGLATSGLWDAPELVVVDDGGGVAAALVERLVHSGHSAHVVARVPDGARGVIFLGGLRALRTIEEAAAVNGEAFEAARAAARSLSTHGGLFVTVQDTGGDFGLAGREPLAAWSAGLAGLAKTAAQEWPKASVRAIDLERGGRSAGALADALVSELYSGGPELEVGLHADGRRTTLQSYAQPIAADARALAGVVNERSVLIASGGARGVTAATLIELARVARPKLALLGRTELTEEPAALSGAKDEPALSRALLDAAKASGKALAPLELRTAIRQVQAGREIRATLAALAAAGAEAMYVAVDVTDASALRGALAQVRQRFGAITGIVHGAGVLADKLLVDKTPEHFQSVFTTKVAGLQAMLSATAEDPIRFICLFSSIAGRTGNAGQSDYAMANEVLNKVAAVEARRRGAGCVVRSLGWGPWESGMVTPALRARFAELGVPLISLTAGAQMLLSELSGAGGGDVELVLGCEPRAGALLAAGTPPEWTADVLVSAQTYPFLDSHRIAGTAVVPLVLVLEWFMRTVCALHPGRPLGELRELKVRRGIRLSRYESGGERFRIGCKLVTGGQEPVYHLELRGADGVLHYTATAALPAQPAAPGPVPPRNASAAGAPWSVAELYPKLLFHGPALQVVRELGAVTAQETEAVLAGIHAQGWAEAAWRTDVAALDGGLQLARLWGIHNLGKPSLPTQVGVFFRHREQLAEGPLRCVLTARSLSDLKTVCDLLFIDAANQVSAELRDVEMHVLASVD